MWDSKDEHAFERQRTPARSRWQGPVFPSPCPPLRVESSLPRTWGCCCLVMRTMLPERLPSTWLWETIHVEGSGLCLPGSSHLDTKEQPQFPVHVQSFSWGVMWTASTSVLMCSFERNRILFCFAVHTWCSPFIHYCPCLEHIKTLQFFKFHAEIPPAPNPVISHLFLLFLCRVGSSAKMSQWTCHVCS